MASRVWWRARIDFVRFCQSLLERRYTVQSRSARSRDRDSQKIFEPFFTPSVNASS